MPNLVIYHENCFDGFGAAWVAKRALSGDTAFLPAKYGDELKPFQVKPLNIYVLDFSFPIGVIQKWINEGHSITVLDHHKTAKENFIGLPSTPRLQVTFDMNRSGAGLTWDHFYKERPRPDLINYIEDRDLWNWKLPYSREVSAYISSFPRSLEVWDRMDANWDLKRIVYEGEAILRFETQKVEELCKEVKFEEICGHNVPVVNAPYNFGSLCGEYLNQHYTDYPFSAYYFDRADGEQQWGLRSLEFDVSVIAKKMGGGGHQRAAGFVKGKRTRE